MYGITDLDATRHPIGEVTIIDTPDGKAYVYALRVVVAARSMSALDEAVRDVTDLIEVAQVQAVVSTK